MGNKLDGKNHPITNVEQYLYKIRNARWELAAYLWDVYDNMSYQANGYESFQEFIEGAGWKPMKANYLIALYGECIEGLGHRPNFDEWSDIFEKREAEKGALRRQSHLQEVNDGKPFGDRCMKKVEKIVAEMNEVVKDWNELFEE